MAGEWNTVELEPLCANIHETPAPAVISQEGGEMNSVEEGRAEGVPVGRFGGAGAKSGRA